MLANEGFGTVSSRARSGPERVTAASAGSGLDWLNFFVANIQTGFGPFVAVYLTTQAWTQTQIGLALSAGTLAAMASQVPAGALVDAIRSKAAVALFSILAFTASALLLALWPTPFFVYLAEVLHGFSSCTLGPAIATMSLIIAGRHALGLRLGRNARFAAIGNGVGAALMGAAGYYYSSRSVFFLTAVLTIIGLIPLLPLARLYEPSQPAARQEASTARHRERVSSVLTNRALLGFAICAMLFTLGNAAMLPLAGSFVTERAESEATLLIAAGIVLPQLIAAALAPALGQLAEARGRRLVLFLGFCTLPIRGVLFAAFPDPAMMVIIQSIDGIAGASLGIIGPLVTSDVAGNSGRYNLSLGFIGLMIGVGATVSTGFAGWIADGFGNPIAFMSLATIGLAAAALVWVAMPETRPS
jgi:MFS family permease